MHKCSAISEVELHLKLWVEYDNSTSQDMRYIPMPLFRSTY